MRFDACSDFDGDGAIDLDDDGRVHFPDFFFFAFRYSNLYIIARKRKNEFLT